MDQNSESRTQNPEFSITNINPQYYLNAIEIIPNLS